MLFHRQRGDLTSSGVKGAGAKGQERALWTPDPASRGAQTVGSGGDAGQGPAASSRDGAAGFSCVLWILCNDLELFFFLLSVYLFIGEVNLHCPVNVAASGCLLL